MFLAVGALLGLVFGDSQDIPPDDGYCNYGGTVSGTAPNLKCTCREGYSGTQCETFSCSTNRDCHNHGICYKSDTTTGDYCVCPLGFTGADCYVRSCGEPYFDKILGKRIFCNGGGECELAAPNRLHNYYKSSCTCRNGFSGDQCEDFSCKLDSDTSSGGVQCPEFSAGKTTCKVGSPDPPDPNTPASTKTQYYCDGCPSYATGRDCGIFYCGAEVNGSDVTFCSGNGNCTSVNQSMVHCSCNDGYVGEICDTGMCTNRSMMCGLHGWCQEGGGNDSSNVCVCTGNYQGDTCSICAYPFLEHNYYQLNKDNFGTITVGNDIKACAHPACIHDGSVCNNGGTCVVSLRQWTCECQDGFVEHDGNCIPTDGSCGGYSNPCGGAGDCVFGFDHKTQQASWVCICQDGFRRDGPGGTCLPLSCFSGAETFSCSRHGTCSATGKCICDQGYTGDKCNVCASGFREGEGIYSDSCFPVKCGTDGKCDGLGECAFSMHNRAYYCECIDGLVTDSKTGGCITCQLPNCAYCGSDSHCMECALGYYLQMDGSCTKCDKDCTTCKGPGKNSCVVCAPGTVRANATSTTSGCVPECKVTDECTSCDAIILGSRYCSRCKPGMYPLEGVCTSSIGSQRNYAPCLRDDSGVCKRCSAGYLLFEGGCYWNDRVPGNVICRNYVNDECQECGTGFFDDSGSCDSCPANCASCSSKTVCSSCRTGYYPQNSQCVGCHDTCLRCNGPEENKCSSCASGYFAQFLLDGLSFGSCRPCGDTRDVNGIKGQKGCSECMLNLKTDPPSFLCLDPPKRGLSGGAVAAIVIVVLVVVGGIAGFCIYWFLFRNKTKTGGKKLRSRTADDTDYVSLMNTDDSGAFI
ncbi:High cysteine membrane protein [Giardia muris]|uniref:High cysteine membrane protein n=1 Tax=Giardia muris TaxID=5742 RepID=A0A4Z1T0A9_GIAMU|nr:High cysteine membrane protein [Giardia muris]|eukprot:TNJ26347.1 High cysteine membrane protein [Giardia muris]